MSGDELKELLQMAREAEQSGDEQRAGELYQQIVDEHPSSRAAKIAGERLMELDNSTSSGSATSDAPEADNFSDVESSPGRASGAMGCPQCGGTNFVYGDLTGKQSVEFDPDDGGLFSFDNVPVHARVCRNCGNVQAYVENPKSVE